MEYEELKIEGRNPVLEAFRSGKSIDKLFVLDGSGDGPIQTITGSQKEGYDRPLCCKRAAGSAV